MILKEIELTAVRSIQIMRIDFEGNSMPVLSSFREFELNITWDYIYQDFQYSA